jgi:hypothetical protein
LLENEDHGGGRCKGNYGSSKGEQLPGDEVHDGGLAGGQPQGGQGHVPVQEAALVDEPQDLRLTHLDSMYIPVCSRSMYNMYNSGYHYG